jgi:tartrate-resistant acid phosphatase type 5
MKRRSFLKTTALSVSAFFITRSISAREKLHEAWHIVTKPSVVKNARPIPAFTPFRLDRREGMRFLVMGDWGTGGQVQASVARAMAATADTYGCDYIISTGDNIYPSGVQSAEDSQWKRKFETVYHGQGLKQPVFPTLGNHDYILNPDAQIAYSRVNPQWRFPSRYYTQKLVAADGTTVQLFSLDTQRVQLNEAGAAVEQRAWLDAELTKSTAKWKIVFGHHMLYSNGIYGNLSRIRAAFEDVLKRHKVPIYMCGHDHDIQLLQPSGGVSYVVSGGGGGHRDTSWGENTRYAATNMGYVWMAVSAKGIHLHFHDADGALKYAQKIA